MSSPLLEPTAPASADSVESRPTLPIVIKGAVLGVVALLLFLRRPDAFLNPQFWAEDGALFFIGAFREGALTLLQPYNGYHHGLIRIGALLGTLAPVRWAPTVYAILSLGAVWAMAAYCLSERMPFKASTRVLMALFVVAAPTANEVFMTLTNTQWVLAPALLLLLVSRAPQTRAQQLFDVAAVILLGLTGPFVVLFLPLFVLRAALQRTGHSLLLAALAAGCAGIQSLQLSPNRAAGHFSKDDPALLVILPRYIGGLFAGSATELPGIRGLRWMTGCALLLYVALFADAARRRSLPSLIFVGGSLIVTLSACYAFRGQLTGLLYSPRYFYIPSVALLWALLLVPGWTGRFAAAVSLCAFVTLLRDPARFIDYHWKETSKCIGVTRPCKVPINPPGWFVEVN